MHPPWTPLRKGGIENGAFVAGKRAQQNRDEDSAGASPSFHHPTPTRDTRMAGRGKSFDQSPRSVDPAKLQPWLDKYRLGEIWRIGELGGNP